MGSIMTVFEGTRVVTRSN